MRRTCNLAQNSFSSLTHDTLTGSSKPLHLETKKKKVHLLSLTPFLLKHFPLHTNFLELLLRW